MDALTVDILALGRRHGRYGYRRITALLHETGWAVNAERAERIWLREGAEGFPEETQEGALGHTTQLEGKLLETLVSRIVNTPLPLRKRRVR